ncbi:hypothetical protein Hanom_Chr15g01410241 [Helianthus anomalus]
MQKENKGGVSASKVYGEHFNDDVGQGSFFNSNVGPNSFMVGDSGLQGSFSLILGGPIALSPTR